MATTTSPDVEAGTTCLQVIQSVIPSASPTKRQVVASLFVVSCLTTLFCLTAVVHLPAAGPVFGRYKGSYYVLLAVILAAAAVEVATAYWLAFSTEPRVLALAKVVLPLGFLLLLVVFALGGFTIPFKITSVR